MMCHLIYFLIDSETLLISKFGQQLKAHQSRGQMRPHKKLETRIFAGHLGGSWSLS